MSTLTYCITPANPNSHLFEVTLSFESQTDKAYTLALPAWLPGSYMIRDFAKNITQFGAVSEAGNSLKIEAKDKQTWVVVAADNVTQITYQFFAFDQSVRTAYLDSQRGFFNGSSAFLEVKENKRSAADSGGQH